MNRPFILVVDDNAIMAKLICRYLDINGYEAESVLDGLACIEYVANRRPDVILADVMMPRLDGLRMTELLRQDAATRDIPVIIITALSDHETQLRAIHVGATDVMSKPIDESVLIAKVRLLVGAQRSMKHIAALRDVIAAYQRGDANAAAELLASLEADT